ncbi:methyltransferase, TIGR04325 family [Variovorax arabinosiphilus]|uniref:methyltransferase, TIGR04325 family n=1 Tax=Variovorax arabinosiphilus TaxID=3053498 RepID=UPI00257802E2|nr:MULTISPECIES: methyltransferase, TIGR04325 family [unclassified Variovorax]MDM0121767.1 methyltransferase, TIGR04325 family [Variovorax sp. J2L1-78]MDM0130828.1 methyltransferase, TIGR04325 family [Variovorax sp. J2L1-63]MDM0234530.1 methyltransferase, TIGR04325 family [Variovorax sp. J2R1-6]
MPNNFAARWLPPAIRQAANRFLGAAIVFRGPFSNWVAASASTKGYDNGAILERVSRATRQVLAGSARFEQDGIVFHAEPPPTHALGGLLIAAALEGGRLSVLDFGGGLASHYLRWRPLLTPLPEVRWAVVEQGKFVSEGNALFSANMSVSFHAEIAGVASPPNAVLASSVLQYLPEPYRILQQLIDLAPRVIVLDRTAYGEEETVVTQFVPRRLGKASYPLWVLSRSRVHAALSKNYTLLTEFDAADRPFEVPGVRASYHGSIWLRRV